MKAIIILIIIILCVLLAYYFPKGTKILGIPAETLFKKKGSDKNDVD